MRPQGVLTAIQAADLIVHRYGLKKYRILIYGSTTHDVVYCRRCQDAIDRLKLGDNVKLMGKGRPAAVRTRMGTPLVAAVLRKVVQSVTLP